MTRMLMPAVITCALFVGCGGDSPTEEIREARAEHREAIDDARRIDDPGERAEAIDDADEELAEAYADARQTIEHDAGQDARPELRERFEAFRDEPDPAFASRARERIAMIQSDLDRLSTTAVQREGVDDSLSEAREDLQEFDEGEVFDDGKLGVTTAINSAERKLERLAD